jgi:hypothetical protein
VSRRDRDVQRRDVVGVFLERRPRGRRDATDDARAPERAAQPVEVVDHVTGPNIMFVRCPRAHRGFVYHSRTGEAMPRARSHALRSRRASIASRLRSRS